MLIGSGTDTKILTNFLEGRTETSGPGEAFEAAHRIVALFKGAVILLKAIIKVLVGSVYDAETEDGLNGLRIGGVLIRGDALGFVTNRRLGLLEKGFSRLQVARSAEPCVYQITVPIDGAIQVLPLPLDFDVRFVDIPRFTRLSTTLRLQVRTQQRREALFPLPYRLMRKLITAHQKHLH